MLFLTKKIIIQIKLLKMNLWYTGDNKLLSVGDVLCITVEILK